MLIFKKSCLWVNGLVVVYLFLLHLSNVKPCISVSGVEDIIKNDETRNTEKYHLYPFS